MADQRGNGGKFSLPASHSAARLTSSTMNDPVRYRRWCAQKLEGVSRFLDAPFVEIQDPAHLSQTELSALRERVEAMNFALYRTAGETALSHSALKHLCRQAGLGRLVANLFSESSGISEIRVAAHGARRGEYIPYGNRALNWHTDGYYQPPDKPIDGFAMHTVRAAAAGGQNCFLDPEILYLLLRERDVGLAACLFDAEVMTIPPGIEADGSARPARSGPVFSFGGGWLRMRFTLRKRGVCWKDSVAVRAAVAAIEAILNDADNPFILRHRFAAGEGVISNNVLHDRAAFVDSEGGESEREARRAGGRLAGRLVLRARFYDRIDIAPATGLPPRG